MSRFSARTSKSNSPSQAIEDSKRKSSLLKDNSWIRKPDDEDEAVDRDPNFGKSLLSRYKSSETLVSSEGEEVKTTKTVTPSTSVHALTKRFSGSQDELKTSTLPSSKSPSSYTRSTTTSKTTVTEVPKTSTTTTTTTKDGKTTETTVTTTRSDRSPVDKTPPKTESFSERVKSSSKGLYSNYSPTRTTTVTETTVTNNKDVEDKLYDTLVPSPIKGDLSPTDSKTTVTTTETVVVKSSPDTDIEDELNDTVFPKSIKDDVTESKTSISSTETVTVKNSTNGDGIKTTTTTRTSSKAEDELYDTLLPKAITSNPSSPVSYSSYTDDSPTTRTIRTTSYTPSYTASNQPRYEYTSITSPTSYTPSSYRKSSRSDDILTDPVYSTSSMKSVYASPERTVLEKDLCTYCRKPFTGDAKMVLDDLKINCHASCFRCEVCSSTLGHLKAGDSMWIYKRMVHCENCFEVTREKWRR